MNISCELREHLTVRTSSYMVMNRIRECRMYPISGWDLMMLSHDYIYNFHRTSIGGCEVAFRLDRQPKCKSRSR